MPRTRLLALLSLSLLGPGGSLVVPSCPASNPQGIENRFWDWRGQRIRYQGLGLDNDGPAVLLVHGLFVNADHWRQNLPALAEAGYRAYAIDLLGSGWSSKPAPCGPEAQAISGELRRECTPLPDVELGTSGGGRRRSDVDLAHPLGSVYNFYTWAEQLADFADEVIGAEKGKEKNKVTLVCNSIGTISGLQAAVDRPDTFNGVFSCNPNFRELHVAETPGLIQPVISAVQAGLRRYGQPLFDALAKPGTVKQILEEPYFDASKVRDPTWAHRTSHSREASHCPLHRTGHG